MEIENIIGQSYVTNDNYVFKITGFLNTSEKFLATQVAPYPAQAIKLNQIPNDWEKFPKKVVQE